MAWNRSNQDSANKQRTKNSRGISFDWRLLSGLLIIACAVAYFVRSSPYTDNQPKDLSKPTRSQIKAGAPRQSKMRPKTELKPEPTNEIRKLDNGLLMMYHPDGTPAWAAPRQPPTKVIITNNMAASNRTFEQTVFKDPSDVEIAWLLNTEPGEALVGYNDYSDFNDRFCKSLDNPIRIEATDDDDTKMLKKAVIEVREDLAKRMNAGEDLSETMRKAREELQGIGIYREEIRHQIEEIAEKGDEKELSEKDYEDLLNAANLMLEERGAKPISMPAFIKYKFDKERMDIENEN